MVLQSLPALYGPRSRVRQSRPIFIRKHQARNGRRNSQQRADQRRYQRQKAAENEDAQVPIPL
jgi:hypothetical protein